MSLVVRDLGLSSGHVTQCPWRGRAEVGAAASGDSGCQPAGPIGQDPASLVGQHGKVF